MKNYFTKAFFMENKERIIKGAAVTLIVIAALILFFFKTADNDPLSEKNAPVNKESSVKQVKKNKEDTKIIIVDVGGAVNRPKVVELKSGSRVQDAIEAAGGLTEENDISKINRAATVNDGDKIYIPTKQEVESGGYPQAEENSVVKADAGAGSSGKVNINTASASQLQTISGIGPATAEKIIVFRNSNGKFKSIDDIKNVDGIGDKTFEKMKARITV